MPCSDVTQMSVLLGLLQYHCALVDLWIMGHLQSVGAMAANKVHSTSIVAVSPLQVAACAF